MRARAMSDAGGAAAPAAALPRDPLADYCIIVNDQVRLQPGPTLDVPLAQVINGPRRSGNSQCDRTDARAAGSLQGMIADVMPTVRDEDEVRLVTEQGPTLLVYTWADVTLPCTLVQIR